MTMVLLIVLIAVPLLEIAVMIKMGQWLGFWPAFGIVIATFMAGVAVLSQSGLSAAFRVQEAMSKGEQPVLALLDGALLALAGILLVTPGFIADAVGLALLVAPLRRACAGVIVRSVFVDAEVHVHRSGFDPADDDARSERPRREPGTGPVIEGEFERLDERPLRSRGQHGSPHDESDPRKRPD